MITGPQPSPVTTGGGRVESPVLPPLVDRGIYPDSDRTTGVVWLGVPDAAALAAVESGAPGIAAPILFQASDYPDRATARGTIELRGHTSRDAIQKSFQIKLHPDAPAWRGTRVINLLKHPFDLTRARNALSYAHFRSVSGFMSVRTGFVRLMIDGLDRGLYEWIEEPDENFLAAHGLDPTGSLYKAKAFAFKPIDDATAADPDKLSSIVAGKARPDLAKLRRMATAVNDRQQPINDVIAHYFDRANYITWLAVNVLTADFDSGSQNYMLYSPNGYEGWYFLPWDYDGAWDWNGQPGNPPRPRRRQGISNWWWIVLHQRFLSEPANLAELDARIESLAAETITDARSADIMARLHDQIASFVSVPPDLNNLPCDMGGLPGAVTEWEDEYRRVAGNASRALAEYHATEDRPMPFWIYAPISDGGLRLTWSSAFQLHGVDVRYDAELNRTESFDPAGVVQSATGLDDKVLSPASLPSGRYFFRVIARAVSGQPDHWQAAINDHIALDVP